MTAHQEIPDSPQRPPPVPRAFMQGVGTVFQFAGVILFLTSFFVCCGSSLLSRDRATHTDYTRIGWPSGGKILYSAQQALTICLLAGVFFGLAMAAIGLGLQAQRRRAPALAVIAAVIAMFFWALHGLFFAANVQSIFLSTSCLVLCLLFTVLFALAISAWKEMRRNPTPGGFEILPAEYKIPYSHMHPDPPEVRLAREVEQRRERLALQQKELEMLEEKLKRKLQQNEE